MTESYILQIKLLHELHTGQGKELTGRILANRLGQKDTRHIRLAIQALIRDGVPIIGSPKGYYIANDYEDILDNLERLKHYLKMTGAHYKYLKRCQVHHEGQIRMKV